MNLGRIGHALRRFPANLVSSIGNDTQCVKREAMRFGASTLLCSVDTLQLTSEISGSNQKMKKLSREDI
jgi:pilus assembly protein TadC